MRLYCRQCDEPNDFSRNWVNATDSCAHCGAKDWETINAPRIPYELTEKDRRLLRYLGIVRD